MKEVCRECGVTITNKQNVGEERHRWPGPRTDYLCKNCWMKPPWVREKENLPPRPPR